MKVIFDKTEGNKDIFLNIILRKKPSEEMKEYSKKYNIELNGINPHYLTIRSEVVVDIPQEFLNFADYKGYKYKIVK